MDKQERTELAELSRITAQTASKETARTATEVITRELLTRIDERVNYIRTIDLTEIKKHLEKLNGSVERETINSSSNKRDIRIQWFIIGAIIIAIISRWI